MIIYLVGISCVGKTTIGEMLAKKLGFSFFDLDVEIQKHYNKPIEKIQNECSSMNGYREIASIVLDILISKNIDSVISGTPSGLRNWYLRIYKKHKVDKDLYSVYINDTCENVLNRLIFYDKDSKFISKKLDESIKKMYLKEIKADYYYFKDSYKRADFKVDINNVNLKDIPSLIINKLNRSIEISS